MNEHELTSIEDLMREHGLLNRILLAYDHILTLLDINNQNNVTLHDVMTIISKLAVIVRVFIEDYHEKNEEIYIFPVLLKNNQHVDLVNELIKQHKIGRIITSNIIKLSYVGGTINNNTNSTNDVNLKKLSTYIRLFTKLYRFHESREDTIVFPEYKNLVDPETYKKVGEYFEKSEKEQLGSFEKILSHVEKIEKELGLNDLSKISNDTLQKMDEINYK